MNRNDIIEIVYYDLQINDALTKIVSFKHRDEFKSYLYFSLLNWNKLEQAYNGKYLTGSCINMIRNHYRNPKTSPFWRKEMNTKYYLEEIPEKPTYTNRFKSNEKLEEEMYHTLRRLHPIYITLWDLYYKEDKNFYEIASQSKVNYQTVRLYILKIKELLKKELKLEDANLYHDY